MVMAWPTYFMVVLVMLLWVSAITNSIVVEFACCTMLRLTSLGNDHPCHSLTGPCLLFWAMGE